MAERVLATSSTESLTPLGNAWQRSFELISETVRDLLGDRHADLFTEPVATQYGDKFDWYTTVDGKIRKLRDLSGDEYARVEALLKAITSDISQKAQELLESDDTNDQRLGEALTNAIRYPDEESVYILGEDDSTQPVIVNWAWVTDSQEKIDGTLTGMGGKTQVVEREEKHKEKSNKISQTAVVRSFWRKDIGPLYWWLIWLGWLLLALIIAMSLYLMLEACTLNFKLFRDNCPASSPAISKIERESQILRNQIAAVEQEIGIANRLCRPIPDPFATRRDVAGGQSGDLNFRLIWDGHDDLDLYVTCPNGQTIYYRNKLICNGQLDTDSNSGKESLKQEPIENIFFVEPETGYYKVMVHLYKSRTNQTSREFQLRIEDKDGVTKKTLSGTVDHGQEKWFHLYQWEDN